MPTLAPTQAKIAQTPVAPAVPAAPFAPQPGPITSITILQEQVANYSQQLAGLRAQRNILQRQISASSDGTTRAALELRKVPLENQIAQTELDLASVRAQLGSRMSQTGWPDRPSFPPNSQRRGPDPDLIVGLAFAFIFAVMMPISIAFARRIWRGVKPVAAARTEDVLTRRFDRLEQAVDAIAIEVERVSEGQRFVTKVLTERPGTVRQQSAPESNEGAGLPDAKPFLALGAGPIEPIRMPERQAVRQSVTPH
jgi:hypothetical protein